MKQSKGKLEEAAPLASETYTAEASLSKAKAEIDAKQPDPIDAKERFAKLLQPKEVSPDETTT